MHPVDRIVLMALQGREHGGAEVVRIANKAVLVF